MDKHSKDKNNLKVPNGALSTLKKYVDNLKQTTGEASDYLDRLQRLQAEFDNYKKRMLKEKEEFRKYALEGFAFEMLTIVDNLGRAEENAKQNHNYDSLLQGISMVQKLFVDKLNNAGICKIKAQPGDVFDPHLHHAINYEPSEKYPDDIIMSEVLPGYTIGERILRPATVVVSSGSAKEKKEQK